MDLNMTDQLEFPWGEPPENHAASKSASARPPAPKSAQAPAHEPTGSRADMLRQAEALQKELASRSGLHVYLRVTNNRSTMMSVRYENRGHTARLSLHHMFLTAPPRVRLALVRWLRNPKTKRSGEILNDFIRERKHQVAAKARHRVTLYQQGEFHNLARLYQEVNVRCFDNSVDAKITWGRMPPLGKRRSIRFGSYMPADNVIRIHPLLDQEFVPEFFVRYVVFHEMLHAHLGVQERPSGRRDLHGKTFREQEEAYPDFKRASDWGADTANLKRLLKHHKPGR